MSLVVVMAGLTPGAVPGAEPGGADEALDRQAKRLVELRLDVADEETVTVTTRLGEMAVVSDHVRGYALGIVPELSDEDPFHLRARIFRLAGDREALKRGEQLDVLVLGGSGTAAATLDGTFLRVEAKLLEEAVGPGMGCAVTCGPFFVGGLAVESDCGSCRDDRR